MLVDIDVEIVREYINIHNNLRNFTNPMKSAM